MDGVCSDLNQQACRTGPFYIGLRQSHLFQTGFPDKANQILGTDKRNLCSLPASDLQQSPASLGTEGRHGPAQILQHSGESRRLFHQQTTEKPTPLLCQHGRALRSPRPPGASTSVN